MIFEEKCYLILASCNGGSGRGQSGWSRPRPARGRGGLAPTLTPMAKLSLSLSLSLSLAERERVGEESFPTPPGLARPPPQPGDSELRRGLFDLDSEPYISLFYS